MEDILDLYAEPYDPIFPVICFDERPYQLIREVRQPIEGHPGRLIRFDYEYKREGTCNLFIFFHPLAGWRRMKVTDRRTKADFAACMKEVVHDHFPEARRIRVVLDNLNTHTYATLYESFSPQEARLIARKLEFHYTPKHASWLNMAEIELSVCTSQCLDRRLPDLEQLHTELAAWETQRNQEKATVKWQFTTDQARSTLKRLYPA